MKGDAGNPSELYRLIAGALAHPYRTCFGSATRGLVTTTVLPSIRAAAATKRPRMSISNICRGTRLPSVTLAAVIAEALGYSTDDLIGPPAIIEARERLTSGRKNSLIPA